MHECQLPPWLCPWRVAQVADLLAAAKESKHYDNAMREAHFGREYADWTNACDLCAAIAKAEGES